MWPPEPVSPQAMSWFELGDTMSQVELIASYWTLSGGALPHTDSEYSTFEFKQRCEAAARAGFKGIGLWHADIEHVLKHYTLPQMKRILADNDLKHVEVEFLADWFLPPGERRAASDERRELLFKACEGLGARHLKVGDFFKSECSMPRLIDEFGSLCRQAAARGIRIVYELMPFSVIETLEKTRQLVEEGRAEEWRRDLRSLAHREIGDSLRRHHEIPRGLLHGAGVE